MDLRIEMMERLGKKESLVALCREYGISRGRVGGCIARTAGDPASHAAGDGRVDSRRATCASVLGGEEAQDGARETSAAPVPCGQHDG